MFVVLAFAAGICVKFVPAFFRVVAGNLGPGLEPGKLAAILERKLLKAVLLLSGLCRTVLCLVIFSAIFDADFCEFDADSPGFCISILGGGGGPLREGALPLFVELL